MRTSLLAVSLVAALLLVPVGPVAAAVSVDLDAVVGVGLLSNNTFIVLDAAQGVVTIGAQPPIVVDFGSYTTLDLATKIWTQVDCNIESLVLCEQVNLLCGPTLVPHHVIAAIPGTSFKGSIDGIDMRFGKIVMQCIVP